MTTITLPSRLFRISTDVDPIKLTPWSYIVIKQPGRWDDPDNEYRVLYTADDEVGAYVEVLQDMRPNAAAKRILRSVTENGAFPSEPKLTFVALARERLRDRYFSSLICQLPKGLGRWRRGDRHADRSGTRLQNRRYR